MEGLGVVSANLWGDGDRGGSLGEGEASWSREPVPLLRTGEADRSSWGRERPPSLSTRRKSNRPRPLQPLASRVPLATPSRTPAVPRLACHPQYPPPPPPLTDLLCAKDARGRWG